MRGDGAIHRRPKRARCVVHTADDEFVRAKPREFLRGAYAGCCDGHVAYERPRRRGSECVGQRAQSMSGSAFVCDAGVDDDDVVRRLVRSSSQSREQDVPGRRVGDDVRRRECALEMRERE